MFCTLIDFMQLFDQTQARVFGSEGEGIMMGVHMVVLLAHVVLSWTKSLP